MTDMRPIDLTTIPTLDEEIAQAARHTVLAMVDDPEAQAEVLAMLGLA